MSRRVNRSNNNFKRQYQDMMDDENANNDSYDNDNDNDNSNNYNNNYINNSNNNGNFSNYNNNDNINDNINANDMENTKGDNSIRRSIRKKRKTVFEGDVDHVYNDGEVVWAKLEDFPWWPATVEFDNGEDQGYPYQLPVRWFGEDSNRIDLLPRNCVAPFDPTLDTRLQAQTKVEDDDKPEYAACLEEASLEWAQQSKNRTKKKRYHQDDEDYDPEERRRSNNNQRTSRKIGKKDKNNSNDNDDEHDNHIKKEEEEEDDDETKSSRNRKTKKNRQSSMNNNDTINAPMNYQNNTMTFASPVHANYNSHHINQTNNDNTNKDDIAMKDENNKNENIDDEICKDDLHSKYKALRGKKTLNEIIEEDNANKMLQNIVNNNSIDNNENKNRLSFKPLPQICHRFPKMTMQQKSSINKPMPQSQFPSFMKQNQPTYAYNNGNMNDVNIDNNEDNINNRYEYQYQMQYNSLKKEHQSMTPSDMDSHSANQTPSGASSMVFTFRGNNGSILPPSGPATTPTHARSDANDIHKGKFARRGGFFATRYQPKSSDNSTYPTMSVPVAPFPNTQNDHNLSQSQPQPPTQPAPSPIHYNVNQSQQ